MFERVDQLIQSEHESTLPRGTQIGGDLANWLKRVGWGIWELDVP